MDRRIEPAAKDPGVAQDATTILHEIVDGTVECLVIAKTIGMTVYGSQTEKGCEPANVTDKEPCLLSIMEDQKKRVRELYLLLIDIRNSL